MTEGIRETPRTVSVVIPCYNEAHTILKVIDRVREAGLPTEIIIVDDESTDDTPRTIEELQARDPRIRTVRRPNGGRAGLLQVDLVRDAPLIERVTRRGHSEDRHRQPHQHRQGGVGA